MISMKRVSVYGMACAAFAGAATLFAQDDLDNLLSDLESDGAKKAKVEKKVEVKVEEPAPAPAVVEEAKPEEKTEAVAEAPKEEVKAEVAEVKEEPKVEEPVPAPVVVEQKVEEKTEAVAEAPKEEPKEEVKEEAKAEVAEVKEEPKAETPAPAAQPKVEAPKPVAVVKPVDPNAEYVSEIVATEAVRREAVELQVKREMMDAREAMSDRNWDVAYQKYYNAEKNIRNGGLENLRNFAKECAQGMAEARYQAGRQAFREGNADMARSYAEDARRLRHPRAQALIDALDSDTGTAVEKDNEAIAHRRNDKDYKLSRDSIRARLRRSAQYLAVADLDKALEECELVIRFDPYNAEALELRRRIQRRRDTILDRERLATREGMIADVNQAWRPVYAVNSSELKAIDGGTTKTTVGDDPERSAEQTIERRMKEMILPSISFRPPATISDAVDYFRQASRDFDRPDIPIDQRGFNFVLDLGKALVSQGGGEAAADDSNDFSATANAKTDDAAAAGAGGVPMIPAIAASNVSLWDALKLVCRVTKFKFKVQGPVVMVMPVGMTTDELVTRSYNVLESFLERVNGAAGDVQEMKGSGGFGGGNKEADSGEGNQEALWKDFFATMGVTWPENSRIMYIKTIGKLRVTNTAEQLAILEQALSELNVTPMLIEIETRFVEVAQEDLNSLGFEWLLNSDYTLSAGGKLGKVLGLKGGAWGTDTGSNSSTYDSTTSSTWNNTATVTGNGSGGSSKVISNSTTYNSTGSDVSTSSSSSTRLSGQHSGATWTRESGGHRNVGINAVDGTTYQTGMRYLSTDSNHISGEGYSNNDQFMRVNAFLGNADLSMILHMLSQRSDTDLLSAPKVVTKSGQLAVMKVVTEYIYPTEYDVQLTASGGGSSGSSSSGGGSSEILAVVEPENFTMREVGVILEVTPEVSAEGQMINMDLNPRVVSEPTWKNYGMRIPKSSNAQYNPFDSVSSIMTSLVDSLNSLGGMTADEQSDVRQLLKDSASSSIESINSGENSITYYDAPMEQPFFKTRSIETHISIYNGATVVMGGLITEERKSMDDKIPFLGDLPWVGRFFRSRSEWSNKRNLLIFVTARLVDPRGRQISMGKGDDASSTKDEKVTPAPEE